MKTPFYFRTVHEFKRVHDSVCAFNKTQRIKFNYANYHGIRTFSRYVTIPDMKNNINIPKTVPGKKRYIGVIESNAFSMKRIGITPEQLLTSLNVELVKKKPNPPKFVGKLSKHETNLRDHEQFKTLTSVFNKRFGHGNWRIKGPKGLQQILKYISTPANAPTFGMLGQTHDVIHNLKMAYPDGVPVMLIVKEADVDIGKLLFKVLLKT